jgi:hypothetical protein
MASMDRKLARRQERAARKTARPVAEAKSLASAWAHPLPGDGANMRRAQLPPVPAGRGERDPDHVAIAREEAVIVRLLTRYGIDMALARTTRAAAARQGVAPWDVVLVAMHGSLGDERRSFGVSPMDLPQDGDGGYLVLGAVRFLVKDVLPRLKPAEQARLAQERKRAMRSGGARHSLALFLHDDGAAESVCYEMPRHERAQVSEDMLADESIGASGGFDGA